MLHRNIIRRAVTLAFLGLTAAGIATADGPPTTSIPPAATADFPDPQSILDGRADSVDLPCALRLAGIQNAEIFLARERVTEAAAVRQLAAAQLLPSINVGVNFNNHTGPLQAANGQIVQVNRGALYLGLGSNAVGAGTVNVPGLVWNGNVSQVYFGILATRQIVARREFEATAVNNDVLLRVATAYVELLRAEGRRAIAIQNRNESKEVARITANYAKVGQGRQADADRAATELEQRNNDILRSESEVLAASARLCQLLNLDPSTRLHATDSWVVPAPIVPDPVPLCELLAIAITQRPELAERRAAIQQALIELRAAKVLPFSPNLVVGYSAGTFGGGSNLVEAAGEPRFGNFDGRQDFDAVVYWSLRNLGVGNLAQVRFSDSRVRSGRYREIQMLDQVRAEVSIAYSKTHARYAQIDSAERAVRASMKAFEQDFLRTRNREGLPIEVLNSLSLLARSRNAYFDAICDYNRAQFELYVALGKPPSDTLARPVPENPLALPVTAEPTKSPTGGVRP